MAPGREKSRRRGEGRLPLRGFRDRRASSSIAAMSKDKTDELMQDFLKNRQTERAEMMIFLFERQAEDRKLLKDQLPYGVYWYLLQ